ncbi:MAG: DNA translocase FtsK [Chloroflexi bacterium]|nr:DNA translocase FtsK [Chloroflexota bacterium]
MSYNLDALTDENVIDDETDSRSDEREKRSKRTKGKNASKTQNPDGESRQSEGVISRKSLIVHGIFFTLSLAAAVVSFLFRDEIMSTVGFGAMPIGLWATLFAYLLITNTRWLIRRYRETISSLVIVLGGVTVLGIFDAPLGATTGATMGGRLGEILARDPFEWHRYDLVLWQQALAWLRAGALFAIGAAVQFPTAFGITMKVIWIGTLMVVSASVGLFMMAGGAAMSVASKRKKPNPEIEASTEPPTPDPEADSGHEDSFAFQRYANEIYPEISHEPEDLNDAVVVMGNAIVPDHDIDQEEYFADEEDNLIASNSRIDPFVDSPLETDDETGFIEVGSSIGDVSDPILDHDLLAATEPFEDGEAQSMDADADEMLQVITSGAAIESAMNAFPWHLPTFEFLADPPTGGVATTEIKATSDLIEETLADHSIAVTVDQVRVGPTVTMYGLKPGWKGSGSRSNNARQRVRVDTILNREKDIALALSSPNIRFESVVPGSSVVGIEVPNARPTPVNLRTVMDSEEWSEFVDDAALPVPLGMGSGGNPVMADFSKMPHTLVAGATGSGKSVCMNTIVTGLLMTRTPVELRMVMIDPKRVELTPYQGIPHLYSPVIVEPERAVKALKALVKEMMDRFSTLEATGVKNITAFNEKSTSKMPYLLILVDELADLMLTASNEVEQLLVRLAQLGRATGVHLVVATQRPSVDVVTGLIKANFPSRISFAVGSQVDSRTILDATGADKLLGKGDMLYKPIDLSQPVRVQGAFLAEEEIESIVEFWKEVGAPPLPQLDVDGDDDESSFSIPGLSEDNGDALFMQASAMAKSQKTLSTSLLQRRLRIGYPRAARLMDELEDAGIVGPGEPGKPRQVIANG